MTRSERIVVGPGHSHHRACHRFCDGARRVSNAAVYHLRQKLFAGEHVNSHHVDKLLKQKHRQTYKLLPSAGAQRMVLNAGTDFTSWSAALADWKTTPGKYKARPKLPGYSRSAKTYVVSRNGYKIEGGFLHLSGGRKFGFAPLKIRCCETQAFNAPVADTVVADVRIVPLGTSFVVELVYQEEEHADEMIRLDPSNCFAVDLGIDNLATIVSNQPDVRPVLVRGGALKSINAKWNKDRAELASGGRRRSYETRKEEREAKAERVRQYQTLLAAGTSIEEARLVFGPKTVRQPKAELTPEEQARRRKDRSKARHICSKTMKRDNAIRDAFHKISHWLIRECLRTNTGTIVIGWNKGWKDGVAIGAVNNQSFTSLPHARLIRMIRYKAERYGIQVIEREESYTSKASCLDLDPIPTFGMDEAKEANFSGRRVKRGLYRSGTGRTINADVNGAGNILRKEIGDEWVSAHLRAGRGLMDRPATIVHIDRTLGDGHRTVEATSNRNAA